MAIISLNSANNAGSTANKESRKRNKQDQRVEENKHCLGGHKIADPVLMGKTLQDLRYAIRLLARQRVFTLLALTTLALGIGANSAIFAVVNAVLLRPLPFREPGRVVLIEEVIKKLSQGGMPVTPSDLIEYQRRSKAFEAVAGYTSASMDLTGTARRNACRASGVPGDVSSARHFAGDRKRIHSRGRSPSKRCWGDQLSPVAEPIRRRPAIVGRVVDFDRKPTTIVGVLPKDFEFPLPGLTFGGAHDVWIPLADYAGGAVAHRQLQLRGGRAG